MERLSKSEIKEGQHYNHRVLREVEVIGMEEKSHTKVRVINRHVPRDWQLVNGEQVRRPEAVGIRQSKNLVYGKEYTVHIRDLQTIKTQEA